MIIIPFILIDIICGLALITKFAPLFLGFGLILLFKGMWSIYSSFSQGFYFEIMGGIDIIGGIALLLSYYGISYEFFFIIGIFIILKGIISLFMSIKL